MSVRLGEGNSVGKIPARSHEFELAGCRFELHAWGIFDAEDGSVHVAPCDRDGWLEEPHELSWRCWCKPEYDDGVCAHNRVHVEH